MEYPATTIIQPCGHKCVCYECAVKLSQEQKKCPICQERLIAVKQEFPIVENVIQKEISCPTKIDTIDEEFPNQNVFVATPIVRWKSARSLYNPLRSMGKSENGRMMLERQGSGMN
jgi:hypothetical protein